MRPLVLDARSGLMPEPKQDSGSVLKYYKHLVGELAKRGRVLRPGEDLLNGRMDYPWYQPDPNLGHQAEEKERLAQQAKMLSYYLMIVNLPLHQDEHSIEFLRMVLGDEDFEVEMQSREANKSSLKSPAFDPAAVDQFEARVRTRMLRDQPPHTALQVSPNAHKNFFCVPSATTDGGYDMVPMFYMFYDPANGGQDSDHVVVVIMTRYVLPPDVVRILQHSGSHLRNLQSMQSFMKYLQVPDVMVRLRFAQIRGCHLFQIEPVHDFANGKRAALRQFRVAAVGHHVGHANARNLACLLACLERKNRRPRDRQRRFLLFGRLVHPSIMGEQQYAAQQRIQPRQAERRHQQIMHINCFVLVGYLFGLQKLCQARAQCFKQKLAGALKALQKQPGLLR